MNATDLARSVLNTKRPVVMPRKSVGPTNPADIVKRSNALLAGLVHDMVMNPEHLTTDQASTVLVRMSRVLRTVMPMLDSAAPRRREGRPPM